MERLSFAGPAGPLNPHPTFAGGARAPAVSDTKPRGHSIFGNLDERGCGVLEDVGSRRKALEEQGSKSNPGEHQSRPKH